MNTGDSVGPPDHPPRTESAKRLHQTILSPTLQRRARVQVKVTKAVGGIPTLPSARQTELHAQHDSTARRKHCPYPVLRPVYVDGHEASWPLTEQIMC